jgi:hypothetical protein
MAQSNVKEKKKGRLRSLPRFRYGRRGQFRRESDIVVVVDRDLDPPALPAGPSGPCPAAFAVGIPHEDVEGGKFIRVLSFSRHFSLSFCCITLTGDATGKASSRPRRHT